MATWSKTGPQICRIPVRAGSVEVVYAGNTLQLQELRAEIDGWERAIDGHPSPSQRDSLELARYAIRRWKEAHAHQRTAVSVSRLKEMIEDNPRLEVSVLAAARAGWLKAHRLIGLCTFRRTWCNNLALDAIAAHPILDERKNSPIAGLGGGLIHHVCSLAEDIQANTIWGECTQNSKDFYSAFVDRPENMQDLIVLPASAYVSLKDKLEAKWQMAGRPKERL